MLKNLRTVIAKWCLSDPECANAVFPYHPVQHDPPDPETKNLSGLGGSKSLYMFITWSDIYEDMSLDERMSVYGHTLPHEQFSSRTLIEGLFFAYFGPLEWYCDKVFRSAFDLSHNGAGVSLRIIDQRDKFFWNMDFGKNDMPTFGELESKVRRYHKK